MDDDLLDRIGTATARLKASHAERDAAIREAVQSGISVTAIARAADLSRAHVYRIRDAAP